MTLKRTDMGKMVEKKSEFISVRHTKKQGIRKEQNESSFMECYNHHLIKDGEQQ